MPNNETEVRALGTIPISDGAISSSGLFQELRALRIPEPLAAVLGKHDIQVAMALESIQRSVARVIDKKAGQALLEAYEAKLDAEKEIGDEVSDVEAVVALSTIPARQPLILPQRPAAPSYAGESVNELVLPIHPDQLGGGQVTLAAFQGVALLVVNGVTVAAQGDANTTVGLARLIQNGYCTVSLGGDRRLVGLSGLTAGLVYYIQTPGTANLIAEVNLVTGRTAKGVFRAISSTEGKVIDWAPFVVPA